MDGIHGDPPNLPPGPDLQDSYPGDVATVLGSLFTKALDSEKM